MQWCENCAADDKKTEATIRLGDGLRLCLDCWEASKDDCEPVESAGEGEAGDDEQERHGDG